MYNSSGKFEPDAPDSRVAQFGLAEFERTLTRRSIRRIAFK
jgi:hypothetical protein